MSGFRGTAATAGRVLAARLAGKRAGLGDGLASLLASVADAGRRVGARAHSRFDASVNQYLDGSQNAGVNGVRGTIFGIQAGAPATADPVTGVGGPGSVEHVWEAEACYSRAAAAARPHPEAR